MPILKQAEILELHKAALAANLARSRTALLASIAPAFVQGLDDAPNATAQLLQDLNALNDVGTLADGSRPLAVWLRNAETLAGARVEVEVFIRLRVVVEAAPAAPVVAPTPPAPVAPVAPAPRHTRAAPPPASGSLPSGSLPSGVAFPPPLLEAYRQKKLAVLFGSGLSLARDVQGNFPRWSELPDRLLDQVARQGVWSQQQIDAMRGFFKGGHVSLEGMLTSLDMIKSALRGARKYREALIAIFQPMDAAPGDVHRALVGLGVDVLLTTNYDELLEAVEGPPRRRVYTWPKADQAFDDIRRGRKLLLKSHGSAEDDASVVMTRAEYAQVAADLGYQRTMSHLLQSHTFLLVGYGINDPLDLDLVFGLNAKAFGAATSTHYALMHRSVSATDRDRWQREMNIQTVEYDDHGDLPAILDALAKTPPNPP